MARFAVELVFGPDREKRLAVRGPHGEALVDVRAVHQFDGKPGHLHLHSWMNGNVLFVVGDQTPSSVQDTLTNLRIADGVAAPPTGPLTLEDLYKQHRMRLIRLALLLVDEPATAEDVVQEAFTGLYRRWNKLRDPDAAVAFLNRSVVNAGRDTLRRKRRAGAAVLRLVPRSEELASAEQAVVDHAEHDRLWAAVVELPMRQRQVLVLRYYLDQSEAEIAETLGVSRGSVKKHASRGIAALAQQWEAQP